MAIHFPCLQTELSLWFNIDEDDVSADDRVDQAIYRFLYRPEVESSLKDECPFTSLDMHAHSDNDETITENDDDDKKKTIELPPVLEQPKSTWLNNTNKSDQMWLATVTNKTPSDQGSSLMRWISADKRVDLMEPVKSERPQSHWLATKSDQEKEKPADERVPSLTTSLWLASSPSSSFTCVTAETSRAASIEWPDILFKEGHRIWLGLEEEDKVVEEEKEEDGDKVLEETIKSLNKLNLKREVASTNSEEADSSWLFGSPEITSSAKESKRPKLEHSWLSSTSSGFDEPETSQAPMDSWLSVASCDQHSEATKKVNTSVNHETENSWISATSCDLDFVTSKSDQVSNWLVRSLHEAMNDCDDDSSIAIIEEEFDMIHQNDDDSDFSSVSKVNKCDQGGGEGVCHKSDQVEKEKVTDLGFWLV